MKDVLERIKNARHAGIFVFIWGFIWGVFVSSSVTILPGISLGLIVLFILALLLYKVFKKENRLYFLVLLFLLAWCCGAFRYSIKDFHEFNPYLETDVEKTIETKGIVISEPERRDNDVRIRIKTPADTLLVTVDAFSRVDYGDEVSLKGKLRKPGVIASEAGRDFDYASYLSKDDIYYTMSYAEIEVLSSGHGNGVQSFLLKLKKKFTNKMEELLAEPESSLLAGLLVSGKQALPQNIIEEFKRAGVVHIVVLSGYNITIIAEFLGKIFAFIGLTFSLYASVVGIVLFVLLTGATATVVRASLMALIVVLGKLVRRPYSVSRALLIAGFCMILENPKILVFDPSFQLSYLAVLALVYVAPIVEKYLDHFSSRWGFKNMLATTIATQVTVLPYLLYSMGNVSVVGLPSNILILLIVPFTMLIGFLGTILGFVSYYLALPFAYIAHLLLSYILWVADLLGNLHFASVSVYLPVWLMMICYIGLGLTVWRFRSFPHNSAN